MLISSFKSALERFPDSELRIGGDGYLKAELTTLVENLGISNKVFFLGNLDREQVKYELDNCNIFLSTSLYETFGIAIIEALACGKPVIATDSGGPRDIITEHDGILVHDHSTLAFSRAIIDVVDNYSRYDSAQIRASCFERFSEEIVINRIINVYTKILSN